MKNVSFVLWEETKQTSWPTQEKSVSQPTSLKAPPSKGYIALLMALWEVNSVILPGYQLGMKENQRSVLAICSNMQWN